MDAELTAACGARSLAVRMRILLLDKSFFNQDANFREKMRCEIRRLRGQVSMARRALKVLFLTGADWWRTGAVNGVANECVAILGLKE